MALTSWIEIGGEIEINVESARDGTYTGFITGFRYTTEDRRFKEIRSAFENFCFESEKPLISRMIPPEDIAAIYNSLNNGTTVSLLGLAVNMGDADETHAGYNLAANSYYIFISDGFLKSDVVSIGKKYYYHDKNSFDDLPRSNNYYFSSTYAHEFGHTDDYLIGGRTWISRFFLSKECKAIKWENIIGSYYNYEVRSKPECY